jgi:hypothetical protein
MLWVTFGCRGASGMAAGIGSNIKDENYFALRSADASANSRPGRAIGRECRQMEAPMLPRIELKGAASLKSSTRHKEGKLLLGAGESAFAQLPQRDFAAHRFAIGFA